MFYRLRVNKSLLLEKVYRDIPIIDWIKSPKEITYNNTIRYICTTVSRVKRARWSKEWFNFTSSPSPIAFPESCPKRKNA
jgi:hypothetical protein